MIEVGSCWKGVGHYIFQVISRVEIDGHIWIHYKLLDKENNDYREFSCYEESFLERFYQIPECPKT
jgi:hypothetical protein